MKPQSLSPCPRCHGHDSGTCWQCGGTGETLEFDGYLYPNTRAGRYRAAYARRVAQGKEPRKRTDYAREYMRAKRAKQKDAK